MVVIDRFHCSMIGPRQRIWAGTTHVDTEIHRFLPCTRGVHDAILRYNDQCHILFATKEYTTSWQLLEVEALMGCTISPVLLVMAMEMIVRVAEWRLIDMRRQIKASILQWKPSWMASPVSCKTPRQSVLSCEIWRSLTWELPGYWNSSFPGEFKMWCFQFGLLSQIICPM